MKNPEPYIMFGDLNWRCALADVRLSLNGTIHVEGNGRYGDIEECLQLASTLLEVIVFVGNESFAETFTKLVDEAFQEARDNREGK